MKVLMLTMTLSSPNCRRGLDRGRCEMQGSSTTLPARASLTVLGSRRLVLENVETRTGDLFVLDQARQRVLVDHFAARGVDEWYGGSERA